MASPLHVSRSRTYPFPGDQAYEQTLHLPLERVFPRRYGPIPPITGTDQDESWGTLGAERTIRTGDGGTMRERLVVVDPPDGFSYEITEVTGPMKPLASRIEGTWVFESVGTGSRITWTWIVHPRSSASVVLLPVFGWLWKGYARRALDRLEDLFLAEDA